MEKTAEKRDLETKERENEGEGEEWGRGKLPEVGWFPQIRKGSCISVHEHFLRLPGKPLSPYDLSGFYFIAPTIPD